MTWRELFTRAAFGRSGASKQFAPQSLHLFLKDHNYSVNENVWHFPRIGLQSCVEESGLRYGTGSHVRQDKLWSARVLAGRRGRSFARNKLLASPAREDAGAPQTNRLSWRIWLPVPYRLLNILLEVHDRTAPFYFTAPTIPASYSLRSIRRRFRSA